MSISTARTIRQMKLTIDNKLHETKQYNKSMSNFLKSITPKDAFKLAMQFRTIHTIKIKMMFPKMALKCRICLVINIKTVWSVFISVQFKFLTPTVVCIKI